MSRGRMEAFSDGVLAIVITIMVLKLNAPKDLTLDAVKEVFPTFLAYILSFIYVGIYWANHHHLINMTDSVSGRLLWKNLHWIFWMSLIPMATEWMGLNPYKSLPALFYGIILFMCAVSYNIVQAEVIKINGKDSQIFRNIGNDLKGKLSINVFKSCNIRVDYRICRRYYFCFLFSGHFVFDIYCDRFDLDRTGQQAGKSMMKKAQT